MARVSWATAAVRLRLQRDEAIAAANSWIAVADDRARQVEKLKAENAKLREELEKAGLRLSDLHPTIVHRCERLYRTEHLDEAVQTAFKAVEVELRRKIGADSAQVGVALVSAALGGPSPQLRLSDVQAEQDAQFHLFRGVVGAIRNPVSHRFDIFSDRTAAFEAMALASRLLHILDSADNAVDVATPPAERQVE